MFLNGLIGEMTDEKPKQTPCTFHLVRLAPHLTLGIALRGVLNALRKPANSKIFLFGTKALVSSSRSIATIFYRYLTCGVGATMDNPLQMNELTICIYALETVGCMLVDKEGRCAAATSTSGLMNKMTERISDSPTYAYDLCGVSCTGKREAIIRSTLAKRVTAAM